MPQVHDQVTVPLSGGLRHPSISLGQPSTTMRVSKDVSSNGLCGVPASVVGDHGDVDTFHLLQFCALSLQHANKE